MRCLLQLSLLVALAAVIAVDAGVLPVEENFVPTGIIIIMVSVMLRNRLLFRDVSAKKAMFWLCKKEDNIIIS